MHEILRLSSVQGCSQNWIYSRRKYETVMDSLNNSFKVLCATRCFKKFIVCKFMVWTYLSISPFLFPEMKKKSFYRKHSCMWKTTICCICSINFTCYCCCWSIADGKVSNIYFENFIQLYFIKLWKLNFLYTSRTLTIMLVCILFCDAVFIV